MAPGRRGGLAAGMPMRLVGLMVVVALMVWPRDPRAGMIVPMPGLSFLRCRP